MITNEFRSLYPYGQGAIADQVIRQNLMKKVYEKFPLPKLNLKIPHINNKPVRDNNINLHINDKKCGP